MTETPTVGFHAATGEPEQDGLARLAQVSAARVYDHGVVVGDSVVFAAASVGNRRRTVAVIEAGPSGIRVRPVLDTRRLALTAAREVCAGDAPRRVAEVLGLDAERAATEFLEEAAAEGVVVQA